MTKHYQVDLTDAGKERDLLDREQARAREAVQTAKDEVEGFHAAIHDAEQTNEAILQAIATAEVEGDEIPSDELIDIDQIRRKVKAGEAKIERLQALLQEKITAHGKVNRHIFNGTKAYVTNWAFEQAPFNVFGAGRGKKLALEDYRDLTIGQLLDAYLAHQWADNFRMSFGSFLDRAAGVRDGNAETARVVEEARAWNKSLPKKPKDEE